MTATLILVRHAAHGHLGHTLSGRMPGVPLSGDGRAQATALAARLARGRPTLVQTSPVQRARETAQAIADAAGAPLEVALALDEVDFGRWAGRRFDALDGDPDWARWNAARGSARAPGGESMVEVQARVARHLEELARAHAGRTLVLVSHADVIRAAVAHVLGLPLDRLLRFEVDPASATTVLAGEGWSRLLRLNEAVR